MKRKDRRARERDLRKRAQKGDLLAGVELAVGVARSLSAEALAATRFSADDLTDLQIRQRALVANAVARTLGAGHAPAKVLAAVDDTHAQAQSLADRFVDRRIVCREGCAWCCHMRVTSSPAEVLAIAAHLQASLSAVELGALRARIAVVAARTAGLAWTERPPTACPLLAGDRCTIYPVRPLSCRAYHSFDVTPCKEYVERGTGVGLEVQISNFKRAPYDQARQGMKDAVDEHGLESQDVDFAIALGVALGQPDAIARWLRGDRLFSSAYLPKDEPSPLRRRLPTIA